MSSKFTTSLLSKAFSLTALLAALAAPALAQTVVTGVTWREVSDRNNDTVGGVTYQNRVSTVQSLTTASGTYDFASLNQSLTAQVYVRATSNNYNVILWQQEFNANNVNSSVNNVMGTRITGDSDFTLSQKLTQANGYNAIKNTFDNSADTGSDIERIDVVFNSTYTVNVNDVLVFFDFSVTPNDNMRIVPFTSGNDSGVTTYASQGTTIETGEWGQNNKLTTPDGLSGATNTNYYSHATYRVGADGQIGNIVGSATEDPIYITALVVTMGQLGLTQGQQIQGYSVMAADVTSTNLSDLTNFNNSNVYSQNTTNTAGGADFIGFWSPMGRRPVPEPSTYGAIAAAGALGFLAWRRRRKLAAPSAA
jgi:hypothetical protein